MSTQISLGASPITSLLHDDSARNRLVGIGLISAAVLMFSVLDTSAKWLVASLPLVQIVWMRFVGHVLVSAVVLGPRHGLGLVRTRRPGLQAVRALLLPAMTAMNFWALKYLQLAETGSIMFLAPILVALIGSLWLNERLDRGRWGAILIGFAGVLVILQPGTRGFHPAMLVSLLQAVMYAVFMVLTRTLAATDRPAATQFLSALASALLLTPLALAAWVTPETPLQWVVVCLTGLSGGLGHQLLAMSHRYAPASTVTPFIYQQILYMTLLGYLVFGDVPGLAVVAGGAIVVGSGLYLLVRERRGPGAGSA
ncbi:MAG: DMT family transporter [Burkholderiaceae bacterium]|nr:DMT family transporter [Burkholderiaceae bacterium]